MTMDKQRRACLTSFLCDGQRQCSAEKSTRPGARLRNAHVKRVEQPCGPANGEKVTTARDRGMTGILRHETPARNTSSQPSSAKFRPVLRECVPDASQPCFCCSCFVYKGRPSLLQSFFPSLLARDQCPCFEPSTLNSALPSQHRPSPTNSSTELSQWASSSATHTLQRPLLPLPSLTMATTLRTATACTSTRLKSMPVSLMTMAR